jgi:hypothetical protein
VWEQTLQIPEVPQETNVRWLWIWRRDTTKCERDQAASKTCCTAKSWGKTVVSPAIRWWFIELLNAGLRFIPAFPTARFRRNLTSDDANTTAAITNDAGPDSSSLISIDAGPNGPVSLNASLNGLAITNLIECNTQCPKSLQPVPDVRPKDWKVCGFRKHECRPDILITTAATILAADVLPTDAGSTATIILSKAGIIPAFWHVCRTFLAAKIIAVAIDGKNGELAWTAKDKW